MTKVLRPPDPDKAVEVKCSKCGGKAIRYPIPKIQGGCTLCQDGCAPAWAVAHMARQMKTYAESRDAAHTKPMFRPADMIDKEED
jgi:hypothetical protein